MKIRNSRPSTVPAATVMARTVTFAATESTLQPAQPDRGADHRAAQVPVDDDAGGKQADRAIP